MRKEDEAKEVTKVEQQGVGQPLLGAELGLMEVEVRKLLIDQLRARATNDGNAAALSGLLAHDCAEIMQEQLGESESKSGDTKLKKQVLPRIMHTGYRDPLEQLESGELKCRLKTAGLRRLRQMRVGDKGKCEWARLESHRCEALSDDAKRIMKNPEKWFAEKTEEDGPRAITPGVAWK